MQAQATDEANATALAAALTRIDAAEQVAREQLAAADRAVGVAADAALTSEAEILTQKVEFHLAEAVRAGEQLKQYVPDQLHVPINQLRSTAPRVRETLERLERAVRDDLHTPVSQLRGLPPAQSDFLAQRRASLIAGTAGSDSAPDPAQVTVGQAA